MNTSEILKEIDALPESERMEVGIKILNECSEVRQESISEDQRGAIESVLTSRISDSKSEPFPADWKEEVRRLSRLDE